MHKRRLCFAESGYIILKGLEKFIPFEKDGGYHGRETEGKNEEEIEKILNLFGYCLKDTISCTVDEIYKKQGIDSLRMREIKFE